MILKEERGQGLTEYLVLLVLIAVVSIGVVQSLGRAIRGKLTTARENINREVTFEDRRD
jgi:Flp pilus assembly pilin Flp